MSYSPELNAVKREYLTAYRAAGAARRRTITNAKKVRKRTIAAARWVPKWWGRLFLVEEPERAADRDYQKTIEEARDEYLLALDNATKTFEAACRCLWYKRVAKPVSRDELRREEIEMRKLEG